MQATTQPSNDSTAQLRTNGRLLRGLDALVKRWPFVALFGLILFSNAFGSFFNSFYNNQLIVNRLMDEQQVQAFWGVAFPVYNAVCYPLGIGLMLWLLVPLSRCRRRLRAGQAVSPRKLELCRRRLVNLPFYQVCINFVGWLPGTVAFPLMVCAVGGSHEAAAIWLQFGLSFVVSALLTTAQTFFLMELFLIRYFYADFFQDGRPAAVQGMIRIPLRMRLWLLWTAVAVPLVALWLVAWNFGDRGDTDKLKVLAFLVTVIGLAVGFFLFWLVGSDVHKWVSAQALATEQIELGNYDVNIHQPRPDEWGQLTDRFNDMAAALGRARQRWETFGQFLNPEVRDAIMENFPSLGGYLQTITVMFADIRGFTRRTAGEDPTKVVELLNRFLTLAKTAIESKGGLIDKCMGDGVMALFGALRRGTNHADQAVAAGRELLAKLQELNAELGEQGQPPILIGIGIHTGTALVGCIGSKETLPDGRERLRRWFTAIGETVNLAQRLEQLTKSCQGPILISEQTRLQLHAPPLLHSHGAVPVPGYDGTLVVHQVREE